MSAVRKVEEWLPEVERSQDQKQWDLQLLTTWDIPDIKGNSFLGNFVVSDSGFIAIAGSRFKMPSLALMRPKEAGVLRSQTFDENSYYSADFIKIRGKEYLVTSL